MNPTINERFIDSVNETISKGYTSKTDIAKNLKIGRTKLSEILNKRMNVSIDTLTAFCLLYGFNPIWMVFGEGTKEESINPDYKELAKARKEIIEYKDKEIQLLKKELDRLKKDKESSVYPKVVAEPKEELSKKTEK